MNTDERRAKAIVKETTPSIPDFDKLWQEFLNSEYRKSLGNQQPYALSVSFGIWITKKE